MNERIQDAIQETVKDAIDESLSAIKFNLNHVIGGLLCSVKLELEKEGGVGDIDFLINHIVRTSTYDGPEGEEYPVWDEENKKIQEILERLDKVLHRHGIEQSWNIGRKV